MTTPVPEVQEIERLRHRCALNGPCSVVGDGCSCSDAELLAAPRSRPSEVQELIERLQSFAKYLRRCAEENGSQLSYDRCATRACEIEKAAENLSALSRLSATVEQVTHERDEAFRMRNELEAVAFANLAKWQAAEARVGALETALRLTGAMPAEQMRLQWGEMTAGEVRTVRAVLGYVLDKARALTQQEPKNG